VGKRNRIEADAEMKSPKYPFAYIVGDNSGYILNDKPLAQIVETCHFTAETAAKNIIADIEGGARHTFKPDYHGFMVSLGSHYGVANAMGIKSKGFIALFFKHFINMFYLFNIAGLNQVWEYCKHEFLDVKVVDHRSFVGALFSYKIRGYWPLLLRMWLGLTWLFEGINKIGEGWLAFASGTKSAWMFSSGVVQAGVKVTADATAAATAAAEAAPAAAAAVDATAAATAAAAAPVVAAAADATSAATAAATTAAAPAAEAVQQSFHKVWDFAQNIIQPSTGFASWWRHVFMDGIAAYISYPVFQTMIVVIESLIGLSLIGGCFSWWTAALSVAMCFFFMFTGMFTWSQVWMIFAGILVMGGAGRAFGLDNWVVPFFKRWWNGTRFARKWHFYGDDPTK
jgi:NADH dehydrogenase